MFWFSGMTNGRALGLAAALYREFDMDEYERIIEPVDRTSLASHCLT
jgi:hypothetical protein